MTADLAQLRHVVAAWRLTAQLAQDTAGDVDDYALAVAECAQQLETVLDELGVPRGPAPAPERRPRRPEPGSLSEALAALDGPVRR